MKLAPLSAGFQSLPPLPIFKLSPSGAASQVGGFVYILGPCGSLRQPLLRGWEFLLLPPQPAQVFSIRGLRLYFPTLEPWGCVVCHPVHQLLPHCQLQLCPPCSTIRHLSESARHRLAGSPLRPAAHLSPSYWSG